MYNLGTSAMAIVPNDDLVQSEGEGAGEAAEGTNDVVLELEPSKDAVIQAISVAKQ